VREPASPLDLLRLRDAVEPYQLEPSDEAIARAAGIGMDQVIRFDLNTLGDGPLPGVVDALAHFDPGRMVEYGDPSYAELRAAISASIGAEAACIIPGAGADELIRLVTTMVVGAGDAVLIPTPTFPMFAVEARLAGARAVPLPRRSLAVRQSVDEIRAAVEATNARLVWICSPNNPTADLYPLDELEAIADGLPAMVVVDAVYQEFAEASLGLAAESLSAIPLQGRVPNLLVLRSLAKAYGLAGARVGYLVTSPELADRFDAARLPISVATPSQAAALGALADPEAARTRQRLLVEERERLAAACRARGWEVLDSVTNFILVRPPDAPVVEAALAGRGLVVRAYPPGPLSAWLRITARAPRENDRLLEAVAAAEG
jgi:histidinol-phosphate aminotransferase